LNHNGSRKANIIQYESKNGAELEKLNLKLTLHTDSFNNDMSSADWAIFGEFFAGHCEGKYFVSVDL
jgi:hypothetical protein